MVVTPSFPGEDPTLPSGRGGLVGISVASVPLTLWLKMAAVGSLSVAGWPVVIHSGPVA